MIYVHPTNPRGWARGRLTWPLLVAQIMLLHPRRGISYAVRWANDAVNPASTLKES